MIGKAYKALVPYYDRRTNLQNFKARPCVVIGKSDESDYVILPISSVNDKSKVDTEYDIFLDSSVYEFLDKDSYLRTHKQTSINGRNLRGPIKDFKKDYNDTYIEALEKVKDFQEKMLRNAIL